MHGDADKSKAMAKKIDVILPILKDSKQDLSKEWFVEYYCFSEEKNELLRFKISKGINNFPYLNIQPVYKFIIFFFN